jgi:hypothetical protein
MTSPTRSKADVLDQLTSEGLVPVIRADSAAIALRIVEALHSNAGDHDDRARRDGGDSECR